MVSLNILVSMNLQVEFKTRAIWPRISWGQRKNRISLMDCMNHGKTSTVWYRRLETIN